MRARGRSAGSPRKGRGAVARPPSRSAPFASLPAERLSGWIDEYAADLAAQGYRPRSIDAYRRALRRLVPLMRRASSGRTLLREIGALKPATVNFYLTTARGFDRWTVETERRSILAFADRARVRMDRPFPRPLAPDVERKLERSMLNAPDHRLRLLYAILRDMALRINEALSLRWSDVVLEPGREGVQIPGKARSVHFMPMHARTRCGVLGRLRRAHRALYKTAREGFVFTHRFSYDGDRRWGYSAALRAWNHECGRAGVQGTPHQLRHTAATAWLREGMSPEVVRRLLRHANMNQIAIYCELTNEDLRRDRARAEA